MSEFPQLKTGVVMQHPATTTFAFGTRVLRFVDGGEQRFREHDGPERAWLIRLEMLDEAELQKLEDFFVAQQGALGDFSFTDPWSGVVYASCRLEGDRFTAELREVNRGRTQLIVRENRS